GHLISECRKKKFADSKRPSSSSLIPAKQINSTSSYSDASHKKRLKIQLQIQGHSISSLVDSGADVSLMKPEIARRLGIPILPSHQYIKVIGTSITKSNGTTPPIEIYYSGIPTTISFLILEIDHDVLIGTDFLDKARALIDVHHQRLIMPSDVYVAESS